MSISLVSEDAVALVTGAGRGIGRSIALSLAKAGARCVVADIDLASAQRVGEEIGSHSIAIAVNVGDEASVGEMVARATGHFGKIDILVNNAAINMSTSHIPHKPFWEIGLEEWNRVIAVNATGTFLCSKIVAPGMRVRRRGRIVNLASTAVAFGRPNYLHYIASKAAIIGMTRSMARELGSERITVNAISPGPVETEVQRREGSVEQHKRMLAMQCIPDSVHSEDLVGAVLFLCSQASRMITGQVVVIDGGAIHN